MTIDCTTRSGKQLTVIVAGDDVALTPPAAVTDAVFVTVPHVAVVVGLVMCTDDVDPAGSLTMQVSVPDEIVHPETGGLTVQEVPGFVGRVSVTIAFTGRLP